MRNGQIKRVKAVQAAGLALVFVLAGASLTSCGSSNRTVTTAAPATGLGKFAGVYSGPWTFTAGINPAAPLYGGTMTLTVAANGLVAAIFTDTLGGGAGSFNAGGVIGAEGKITYAPPPGTMIVGAPSFAGMVVVDETGAKTANGTVSYDFPGYGTWTSSGE